MKIDRGILFGKKARYTHWGLKGCSHGMYSRGGYDFYVYGIKGLFNVIIDKRWGDMSAGGRRFKTKDMKWIRVKDRLPEMNLGSAFKYSEVVAVLTTDLGYPITARLEQGNLGNEPYWYDLLTDQTFIEVTHWMPLPKN